MSKPPSIRAAIQRLRVQVKDSLLPSHRIDRDVSLLCDALSYLADTAEHIDDRDMNPVYEIKVDDADWRAKDILAAMSEALEWQKKDEKEERVTDEDIPL